MMILFFVKWNSNIIINKIKDAGLKTCGSHPLLIPSPFHFIFSLIEISIFTRLLINWRVPDHNNYKDED